MRGEKIGKGRRKKGKVGKFCKGRDQALGILDGRCNIYYVELFFNVLCNLVF